MSHNERELTYSTSLGGQVFRLQALRASLAVFAVALFVLALADPAFAVNGRTRSPFANTQAWYVCRGYNTQSHTGNSAFALDFIIDRPVTAGPNGCTSNNVSASNAQAVYSPVPGTTSACWGSSGVNAQFVCVQSTLGTSPGLYFIIGHVVPSSRVLGQTVVAGTRIGTLAAPSNLNGGISHIHFEVRPTPGSRSIPFTYPNGTRICQQDFPSNGTTGQYAGAQVYGCL